MTIQEIAKITDSKIASIGENKQITEFYVGDFLSRVMGKAPAQCMWFTIMNNINVVGVAVMADISAIVLCEGVEPVAEVIDKCNSEGIALLSTTLSVYDAVKRLP